MQPALRRTAGRLRDRNPGAGRSLSRPTITPAWRFKDCVRLIGFLDRARFVVVGDFSKAPDLVLSALVLADRKRISPWDAAILEATRKAGCGVVLSEDLGAGQSYAGVRVENPF